MKHIETLLERYPYLEASKGELITAFSMMKTAFSNGGKLLVAGNGGSAADAEHIVGELMKGFKMERALDENYRKVLEGVDAVMGKTLGEALLAPTKIYVKALKAVKEAGVVVKACSHITGGGFYENVPRMLKDGTRAVIRKDSYEVPAIFRLLAGYGNIEEKIMYNTYNMGIGMIVAVDPADADRTMEAMRAAGETPYVIGSIEEGEKGVTLC